MLTALLKAWQARPEVLRRPQGELAGGEGVVVMFWEQHLHGRSVNNPNCHLWVLSYLWIWVGSKS